jgi:hypothetical protein
MFPPQSRNSRPPTRTNPTSDRGDPVARRVAHDPEGTPDAGTIEAAIIETTTTSVAPRGRRADMSTDGALSEARDATSIDLQRGVRNGVDRADIPLMDTSRRLRLLPLALATALFAGACSSSSVDTERPAPAGDVAIDDVSDPVASILAASDEAMDASSMHMEFEMAVEAQGMELSGSGESDVVLGDPPQQHMTFRYDSFPGMPEGLEMEMILDGSTMYMRMPGLRGASAFPTPWISMDLDAVVPGMEDFTSFAEGQNDPSNAFGYLQGVRDAEVVGTETVHGFETTHYRGTLDLAEALKQLPRDMRADFGRETAELRRELGSLTMPFDVWLDDDGLVRRMKLTIEAAGARGFTMSMTVDITEYGNDVTLPIPPEEKVTDLTEMLDQGGFGGSVAA